MFRWAWLWDQYSAVSSAVFWLLTWAGVPSSSSSQFSLGPGRFSLFSCSQKWAAASSVTVAYRPRYEAFLLWISSEGVNYATQLFRYVELKTLAKRKRQPNPLKAVKIAFDKETGIILFSSALLDAGRFAVLAALPLHVQETYQFNTFQIDRCYIPYGLGSLIFRWIAGKLPDWNYWFVLPSFDFRAMKVGHWLIKTVVMLADLALWSSRTDSTNYQTFLQKSRGCK